MLNHSLKSVLFISLFFIGSSNLFAQAACCSKNSAAAKKCTSEKATTTTSDAEAIGKAVACCTKTPKETTSGCTPSNCRGAKTKFGEAKVITALRMKLIDLKATMETYEDVSFSERTYSVHGIVGDDDEQSLAIIENEVQLIENEFLANFELAAGSDIPKNKAKKVRYLSERIDSFQKVL